MEQKSKKKKTEGDGILCVSLFNVKGCENPYSKQLLSSVLGAAGGQSPCLLIIVKINFQAYLPDCFFPGGQMGGSRGGVEARVGTSNCSAYRQTINLALLRGLLDDSW